MIQRSCVNSKENGSVWGVHKSHEEIAEMLDIGVKMFLYKILNDRNGNKYMYMICEEHDENYFIEI